MKTPNENRKGYKKTKVGWIPSAWGCVQLTSVAKLESGHTPSRKHPEYWNGSIPWVSLQDVGRLNGREILTTEYSITPEGIKNSSARLLPKGTVIFSRTATVGKVTTLGAEMATSQDFANYVCGPMLQNHFLVQLFRSMTRYWRSQMAGSTHNTVYMPVFERLLIPLPSFDEQQRIVGVLQMGDDLIEKTNDLIKAKQRQQKALMQQLLTGKKRLPGFRGRWQTVSLSDILKHVFRPVEWAPDKVFHLVSVRRKSKGLFRREPLRGDEYKTTDLHELKTGDFLVSKRQVSHGALALVTREFNGCHVSKEYSILVNKAPKRFHMPFFDWLSKTKRLWWLSYVASNGVIIEKLIFDPKTFLKFAILLPPTLEEQVAITDVLDVCEREIHLLKQRLELLRRQKDGLVQKLLTGEVRVKV